MVLLSLKFKKYHLAKYKVVFFIEIIMYSVIFIGRKNDVLFFIENMGAHMEKLSASFLRIFVF